MNKLLLLVKMYVLTNCLLLNTLLRNKLEKKTHRKVFNTNSLLPLSEFQNLQKYK